MAQKNQSCVDDHSSSPGKRYTNTSCTAPLQFHVELVPTDTLMEILRSAKISEVHVQHASSSEELYRLFIAFLIFGSRSCTQSAEPNPNNEKATFRMLLRSAASNKQETITYPNWSFDLPSWKASYYFAISDANRTKLLESELLNFTWDFTFKVDEIPMDFMYVKFGEDNILRSTKYKENNIGEAFDEFFAHLFQPWNFPWKIVRRRCSAIDDNRYDDDIFRSRIQKTIDLLARKLVYKIQVDQYPVLSVSRRDDGLFQLENVYVVFTQRRANTRDIIHLV